MPMLVEIVLLGAVARVLWMVQFAFVLSSPRYRQNEMDRSPSSVRKRWRFLRLLKPKVIVRPVNNTGDAVNDMEKSWQSLWWTSMNRWRRLDF